ncbi:MAG: ribbon-helix-helix protein, CopG family [Sphingobacteriia bacterium]|nr:ribbon-helix-helix protein, CopG family [Sphingobacteriia bacterium]
MAKKRKQEFVTIDDESLEFLEILARDTGFSKSHLIRHAVFSYVKKAKSMYESLGEEKQLILFKI